MKVTLSVSKTKTAGGYWAALPDDRSAQILRQIAASIMDLDDLHDLHVTLAYDKNNPDVLAKPDPDAVFRATVSGVDIYGEDDKVLVLLLDSPELAAEHARIHACGCAKFDFTPYSPHVSLKYGASQRDVDFVKDFILKPGNPPIDLLFTSEYSEKIDNGAR